jgi:hypothetical protein
MGRWGGANAGFNSGVTSFTYPAHGSPWVTGASDIITKTPPTLQSAVETLCIRAGLLSGQFDASPLSSITRKVNSLPVSQIAATRVALDLLMSAFYFEMVVSDKIYFRPRGIAPVANIAFTDLAASTSDSSKEEPLPLRQAADLEIPAQIALTYVNITDDYQPDTQYSDRLITATSQTVTTVQLALGMEPAEAKSVADTMLADQAATVISTTLRLLGDYCRLEPTDVVTVAGPNGESFRVRLVKKTDSYPVLQFDAVVDDASVLVSPGVTSVDYVSSSEVLYPAVTLMELLDIPILAESDNDAGFYVVAKGNVSDWPGSGTFQSTDDIEFVRVGTILEAATFGVCTSTLGDFTGGRIFDEINSVTVDLGALGILTSTTRDAILNSAGLNAMMVGAEFIQYRTARLIAAGIYRLSGLLRGGRGTEWAIAGHVAAERCVALSSTGMARVAMPNSDLGLTRYYKSVTLGGALSSATSRPFVDTAVGLKPFSPILLKVGRDASHSVHFEWQRRTRMSVRMIGTLGISVPLGEDAELYDIEIFADGTFATVVRTITSGLPFADYSAADQTADGLTPGATIYAKVYQRSAAVGRGYPLQAAA